MKSFAIFTFLVVAIMAMIGGAYSGLIPIDSTSTGTLVGGAPAPDLATAESANPGYGHGHGHGHHHGGGHHHHGGYGR